MTTYDVLSRYPTSAALRIAGLVMVALLLRLVATPFAMAALLTGRLVIRVESAITPHPPSPPTPSPLRWSTENTRTRYATTV